MRTHEIRDLRKVNGIVFEIYGMSARVIRYGAPYGKYIDEEILGDDVHLLNCIRPEEKGESVSIETLVQRAAEEICPGVECVYYEIMS